MDQDCSFQGSQPGWLLIILVKNPVYHQEFQIGEGWFNSVSTSFPLNYLVNFETSWSETLLYLQDICVVLPGCTWQLFNYMMFSKKPAKSTHFFKNILVLWVTYAVTVLQNYICKLRTFLPSFFYLDVLIYKYASSCLCILNMQI